MEVKKKTYKTKTKNSSMKSAKKKVTKLSNEELLDRIINKKKNKTNVTKKVTNNKKSIVVKKSAINKKPTVKKTTVKKVTTPKVNKQYVDKKLKEVNAKIKNKKTSSDELYDLLNEKKKLTKQLNQLKKSKPATKKTTTKMATTKKVTGKKTVVEKTPTKKTTKKIAGVKTTGKKTTTKKVTTKKTTVKKPTVQKKKPVQKKPSVQPKIVPKPEEEKPLEFTQGLILKEKPEVLEEEPKKKQFNFMVMALIALLIGIVIGAIVYHKTNKSVLVDNPEVINNEEEAESEEEKLAKLYQECLVRPLDEKDRTDEIVALENELKTYLKKYKTAVGYKDIDFGYTFNYNENQVYYAASSVKMLSVLYLYQEALKGNINLDNTIKYTASKKWGASPAMKNVKLNTNVKLRDLSKYAITVSDNTAYQMLVGYIGRAKIRELGKSLGAKYTLVGGDNFGSITVSDGIAYWEGIYKFISQDNEYAKEYKSLVLSADQNSLSLPEYGIQAAHKYGEYRPYYNDLGIVFSEHPYIVAILTREYGRDMLKKVKDINEHVYNLHLKHYENRANVCKSEIYGQ